MKKTIILLILATVCVFPSCSTQPYKQWRPEKWEPKGWQSPEEIEVICYMRHYDKGKITEYPLTFKSGQKVKFVNDYMTYVQYMENRPDENGITLVFPRYESEDYSFFCIINNEKSLEYYGGVVRRTLLTVINAPSFDLKPYFTQQSWNNIFRQFPEKPPISPGPR